MSDHYDRYNGMDKLLGTNLAEVGTDVHDTNVGNKAQLSDKGTTFENGGEIKRWSKDIISRQAAIDSQGGEEMNKQRKVVITTTYNEMGIIIDTKAEEVAQPNLQPTCNQPATDTISRQATIDALEDAEDAFGYLTKDWREVLEQLPSVEPQIIRCKDCKYWIPYDWMFSEVWRSKNMADYPEDEIGCNLSDMAMKANDFCSRGEKREVTE